MVIDTSQRIKSKEIKRLFDKPNSLIFCLIYIFFFNIIIIVFANQISFFFLFGEDTISNKFALVNWVFNIIVTLVYFCTCIYFISYPFLYYFFLFKEFVRGYFLRFKELKSISNFFFWFFFFLFSFITAILIVCSYSFLDVTKNLDTFDTNIDDLPYPIAWILLSISNFIIIVLLAFLVNILVFLIWYKNFKSKTYYFILSIILVFLIFFFLILFIKFFVLVEPFPNIPILEFFWKLIFILIIFLFALYQLAYIIFYIQKNNLSIKILNIIYKKKIKPRHRKR